jgi:hypothetical protein
MPSEPLPGAAAPRSLIDEVNEFRAEEEAEAAARAPGLP